MDWEVELRMRSVTVSLNALAQADPLIAQFMLQRLSRAGWTIHVYTEFNVEDTRALLRSTTFMLTIDQVTQHAPEDMIDSVDEITLEQLRLMLDSTQEHAPFEGDIDG